MTSNIGATNRTFNPIGMGQQQKEQDIFDFFESAVRQHFRPELYNRIDKIIPFKPLDQDTVRFVVDREIQLFRKLEGIKFRKLDLEIDPTVFDFLAEKGYNSKYGARFLQRKIREELLIPLAKKLNEVEYDDQLLLKLGIEDQQLKIITHADPLALELLIEELNKIQNADYASSCRRGAHQFMEAYHYTMLLQELDQLEDKKKQQKDTFWEDTKKGERITAIMDLKNRMEQLLEVINHTENQLSLMALGLEAYNTSLVERLERWENQMFTLKTDIYSFLFPDSDRSHFALFGRGPLPLLQLYLEIFSHLGIDADLKSVWMQTTSQKDLKATIVPGQLVDIEHFLTSGEIKAPRPGLELVGVQATLKGKLVKFYFTSESGTQRWLFPGEKAASLYEVTFSDTATPIPNNLHRKDFLKRSTVNRSYNGRQFKDTNLSINREINLAQLKSYLIEVFTDQFKGQVLLEMGL